MSKGRILLTNFSKGELSPRMEGRPDLASYFEGGRKIENFLLLRQGGLDRRPGLRMIAEVKNTGGKDTVLLPFEASVDDTYIIEMGEQYARFYKETARLETGGNPIELGSPYLETQLRAIHYTQSVDVLFMFNASTPQHRLSRISDTSWSLLPMTYNPPPSFEKDTDISQGTITLTPAAISGTAVNFTASSACFLAGDVGRTIIFGDARATIITFTSSTVVVANIIDPFPNTSAIPAGSWFLRGTADITLNPNKKEPEGSTIILVASLAFFRIADVGKFVTMYAGLIEITHYTSATQVEGIIRSELTGAEDADPPATPAWTLEVASWSPENGYPRTGEFFQGRLGQASTEAQRTTFWLSAPDSYDKYGVGGTADRAIDYTIAAKRLNRLEWMADRGNLFIGSSGTEIEVSSGKSDEPFGGDIIPKAVFFGNNGSAPMQPVIIGGRVVFVDRSFKKIFAIAFNIEEDSQNAIELTGAAEHITLSGIRPGSIAYTTRPDPRLYFVRNDGTLIALTYFQQEKVIGFTRIITEGSFESVAVKTRSASQGGEDEVWVIVKRTVNGVEKKFVEMFERNYATPLARGWQSFQTDCSVFYKGAPSKTINVPHLDGEWVDVVGDGGYRGRKLVTAGKVTLEEAYSEIEVGLHYDSEVETMRPAIQGSVIEGLERSWDFIFARFLNTLGGRINDEQIQYSQAELQAGLYTGDKDISGSGWDTVGRVRIKQDLPYPMTLLAVFGDLNVST